MNAGNVGSSKSTRLAAPLRLVRRHPLVAAFVAVALWVTGMVIVALIGASSPSSAPPPEPQLAPTRGDLSPCELANRSAYAVLAAWDDWSYAALPTDGSAPQRVDLENATAKVNARVEAFQVWSTRCYQPRD